VIEKGYYSVGQAGTGRVPARRAALKNERGEAERRGGAINQTALEDIPFTSMQVGAHNKGGQRW